MPLDSAVEAEHLAKRYGDVTALADLTLCVARGEVFGFLGPNGAGKTTSVKMLVGLVRPTSGHASVLGHSIGDVRARRKLGYLPELFRYQDWLTPREVLQLHARLIRLDRSEAAIAAALQTVGLAARADDRVGTFSKGMQQRLGLGVALLGDPELIVLDEPTSALDPAGRHEVREIIRTLKVRGTAIFLNSHLLTEVEHVCDRIAIVNRGRVVAEGTIGQIVGRENTLRIRATANGTPIEGVLARFGSVVVHDDAYELTGVHPDDVPRVVAALVDVRASIYAVEPVAASLEERFLQITEDGA